MQSNRVESLRTGRTELNDYGDVDSALRANAASSKSPNAGDVYVLNPGCGWVQSAAESSAELPERRPNRVVAGFLAMGRGIANLGARVWGGLGRLVLGLGILCRSERIAGAGLAMRYQAAGDQDGE